MTTADALVQQRSEDRNAFIAMGSPVPMPASVTASVHSSMDKMPGDSDYMYGRIDIHTERLLPRWDPAGQWQTATQLYDELPQPSSPVGTPVGSDSPAFALSPISSGLASPSPSQQRRGVPRTRSMELSSLLHQLSSSVQEERSALPTGSLPAASLPAGPTAEEPSWRELSTKRVQEFKIGAIVRESLHQ